MEANTYFDSMYFELNFLKTRINDVIRAMEQSPCLAKEKVNPQLPRLRYLAAHLTRRIEQLWSESPADWQAACREVESHQEWPQGPFHPGYADGIAPGSPWEHHRSL